jgi:hypothetical protein
VRLQGSVGLDNVRLDADAISVNETPRAVRKDPTVHLHSNPRPIQDDRLRAASGGQKVRLRLGRLPSRGGHDTHVSRRVWTTAPIAHKTLRLNQRSAEHVV